MNITKSLPPMMLRKRIPPYPSNYFKYLRARNNFIGPKLSQACKPSDNRQNTFNYFLCTSFTCGYPFGI